MLLILALFHTPKVLNIGLNDETRTSLAEKTNKRFVADSYRRLIQGFSSIVLGVDGDKLEDVVKHMKKDKG